MTAAAEAGEQPADQQASKSTAVVGFGELQQGIAEMLARVKDRAYDLTTTAGDKEARRDRKDLVRARNAVEERRLELNRKARAKVDEEIEACDRFASELAALLAPHEKSVDEQITADEQRRATEKAERDRIEAERIAAIQRRIDDIRDLAVNAVDASSADVLQSALNLRALRIEAAEFEELLPAALAARDQVMNRLHELHGKAQQAEAQAKRLQEAEAELESRRQAEAARQKRESEERAAEQARQAEANRAAAKDLEERQAALKKQEDEAAERRRKEDQEAADRRAAADKEARERREKAEAESRAYQAGLAKIRTLQSMATVTTGASLEIYDAAIEMVEEVDTLNDFPLELCDTALQAREATLTSLRAGRAARAAEIDAAAQRQREEAEAAEQRRKEQEAEVERQRVAEAARVAALLRLQTAADAMFELLKKIVAKNVLGSPLQKQAEAIVRMVKGSDT